MDAGGQSVCLGHFTAREKALVFIELEAEWALELAWMIWRKDSSLVPSKILQHILQLFCTKYSATKYTDNFVGILIM